LPAFIAYPKQAEFGRTLPKNKIYEHSGANTRLEGPVRRAGGADRLALQAGPRDDQPAARPGVPEIQVFAIQLKMPELHRDVLRCIDGAVQFPIIFELTRAKGPRPNAGGCRVQAPSEADCSRWVLLRVLRQQDGCLQPLTRTAMPLALDLGYFMSSYCRLVPVSRQDSRPLPDLVARVEQAAKAPRGRKTQADLPKKSNSIARWRSTRPAATENRT
jgi:hypothetical protein